MYRTLEWCRTYTAICNTTFIQKKIIKEQGSWSSDRINARRSTEDRWDLLQWLMFEALCLVIFKYNFHNLPVDGWVWGMRVMSALVVGGGICVCQEAVWPITAISGQLDGSQGAAVDCKPILDSGVSQLISSIAAHLHLTYCLHQPPVDNLLMTHLLLAQFWRWWCFLSTNY